MTREEGATPVAKPSAGAAMPVGTLLVAAVIAAAALLRARRTAARQRQPAQRRTRAPSSTQAMAPTAIRDESDALIARWAATALEES